MEKLFRYLVVCTTLLYILYWCLPYFDYHWMSNEEIDLANYNTWGAILPNHLIIHWGIFISWVLVSIGLFFFIPIARILFVIMQVTTTVLSLFMGYLILPPFNAALAEVVVLLDGVILAMLYLTSVSTKFEIPPNKAVK